jgi:hypothetical protein
MREEGNAGCLRPPRVIGPEDLTEVAEPGGRQECIAEGMRRDVSVGVTGESRLSRPQEPGEPKGTVSFERVDIRADPDEGD